MPIISAFVGPIEFFWNFSEILNVLTEDSEKIPFSLPASTDQTIQFLDGFLIFLSLPTYGKLRKIKKPSKNCIVWSVEAGKVKCREIAGIHTLTFSLYSAVVMHPNGPKCIINE